MGLLNRAAVVSDVSKPDPMTAALVERILRLAPNTNRAYMVLSLLKTYIPFQGALIFEKTGDHFTTLEAIGLDAKAITIDVSEILPLLPDHEESWFAPTFINKINAIAHYNSDNAHGFLLIKNEKQIVFFIFFHESDEVFPISEIAFILSKTRSIFSLKNEVATWNLSEWIRSVFTELLKPGSTLTIGIFEKLDNLPQLEKALGNRARTHKINEHTFIVIMDTSFDPQLIFHRIQKSFNTTLLYSFDTADSLAAIQRIS